jgi:hypothetical protein
VPGATLRTSVTPRQPLRPASRMPPSGTGVVQSPPTHVDPAEHLWPHEPQLSGSRLVGVHWPLQESVPGGHPHLPATHCVPALHVTPHAPQFVLLFWRSTHEPAQFVVPPVQPAEHAPLLHT